MQALSQLSYTPIERQPNCFDTLALYRTTDDRFRSLRLAEWTGLEPATPGVTGRYSNQLNYRSKNLASPRGFEPRYPP